MFMDIKCCEHNYVYGGIVFEHVHKLPGSGARERKYYNWWYCRKCVSDKYKYLPDADECSYDEIKYGALPKA